jgi:hypothetical protein
VPLGHDWLIGVSYVGFVVGLSMLPSGILIFFLCSAVCFRKHVVGRYVVCVVLEGISILGLVLPLCLTIWLGRFVLIRVCLMKSYFVGQCCLFGVSYLSNLACLAVLGNIGSFLSSAIPFGKLFFGAILAVSRVQGAFVCV